jgi:lysophospholipase L1-like esterase
VLAGAAAAILAVGFALSTAPAPSAAEGLAPDVAEAMGIADGGPTEVSLDDTDETAQPSPGASPAASASAEPAKNPNGNLSALGDSVMLGARNTLKETIPGTKVDAAVSRFPGAFVGRLKKYVARDKLADTVVIHAGTNGVMPEDMLRTMLDTLKDIPTVVVVNDNMPRSWRNPNNKVIDTVVPDFDNAVLADWYALSKDRPEYFVSDGIHLTAKGARAYAQMIKKAAGL